MRNRPGEDHERPYHQYHWRYSSFNRSCSDSSGEELDLTDFCKVRGRGSGRATLPRAALPCAALASEFKNRRNSRWAAEGQARVKGKTLLALGRIKEFLPGFSKLPASNIHVDREPAARLASRLVAGGRVCAICDC